MKQLTDTSTRAKTLLTALPHLMNRLRRLVGGPSLHCDLAKQNFTLLQLKTLWLTFEQRRLRMTDLSRELGLTLPTITHMIDDLVAHDWLTRSRDDGDRRTVWVSLTPKGGVFMKQAMRDFEEHLEGLMGRLSSAEQMELVNAIEHLLDLLGRLAPPPKVAP